MISIGIDVSKRKSTVAIINVMGEILQTPFDIEHSQIGLQKLWDLIKDYPKIKSNSLWRPQEYIT